MRPSAVPTSKQCPAAPRLLPPATTQVRPWWGTMIGVWRLLLCVADHSRFSKEPGTATKEGRGEEGNADS